MATIKKLVDDDLDSSSEFEENEENTNDNSYCHRVQMPLNQIISIRKVEDDDLDSSSSESELGNAIAPGPSTSARVFELKDCNISENGKENHFEKENDNINISKSIDSNITGEKRSSLQFTDSDSECAGPSCNFGDDDSDLDELEDKKYRPKQSKQSKAKKKSKKKVQKSGTGSNKNNDKNPKENSDDGELEIKSNVPLLSSGAGRKNTQPRRSANQKPRQYRRDKGDRNVATQKPPKIPNIPHPHGHVEVKRVTANDAINILESLKTRLRVDSDQEGDNKKSGGTAKLRADGGREICSVLVIRKKPEFCSDSE